RLILCRWSASSAWLKFKRATFMPVWISCLRTFSEALAGPMVQTIFVFRILSILHARKGGKEVKYWNNEMMKYLTAKVKEGVEGVSSLHSRSCALEAWIKNIAECIAEQIDAKNCNKDAKTGKQRQPPRRADVDSCVGEHGAPGWNFGWHADT